MIISTNRKGIARHLGFPYSRTSCVEGGSNFKKVPARGREHYNDIYGESFECRQVERQVFFLFRGVIDSVRKGSSNRYYSRISCRYRCKYRRQRNQSKSICPKC
ncbi:uncharacterized protein LOC109718811 [Ananas comosus]|uniref:Uncharacterized protein LOC109718811 n=1 Tax=Ananas comosus TaxID=4615 RepID=A0A6P5FWU3_ANACO|nr:uncharacterized protein LOC109718811 [Ananas comosus]